MKTLCRAAILCGLVVGWAPGLSAQELYVALRGGPSWAQETHSGRPGEDATYVFGTGSALGGAFGQLFASGVFAEAEFSLLRQPLDISDGMPVDATLRNSMFLANVGYIFGSSRGAKPFVGFGAGIDRLYQNDPYFDDAGVAVYAPEHWTKFVYQARAGVAFPVARRAEFSVGYRFVRVSGDKEDLGADGVITTDPIPYHLLEFALKFRF